MMSNYSFSKLAVCVLLVCACSEDAHARDISYKLDEMAASKLVAAAVDGDLKSWKWYDYQGPNSKMNPPFFAYEELGKNMDALGWYVVNPWTGRVWDDWNCKIVSSPLAQKMQSQIKRKFSAGELKQYRALNDVQPTCWGPEAIDKNYDKK